jgi:riboflavin synthase
VFTGIVEEVGTLVVREDLEGPGGEQAAVLRIRARRVLEGVGLGDSIAVNGVCLTVTGVELDGADGAGVWSTDVMAETLVRSSLGSAAEGQPLNLERAVTPHTRLGGHLMQGHVDGVGQIVTRTPGEHWEVVRIALPPALARYVVEKGSVAVDGVSLTVSAVSAVDIPEPWFEVSLIPTTLRETTLGARAPGEPVNLEVDVIAKYVERLLGGSPASELASSRGDTARLGTNPTSVSEEDS